MFAPAGGQVIGGVVQFVPGIGDIAGACARKTGDANGRYTLLKLRERTIVVADHADIQTQIRHVEIRVRLGFARQAAIAQVAETRLVQPARIEQMGPGDRAALHAAGKVELLQRGVLVRILLAVVADRVA